MTRTLIAAFLLSAATGGVASAQTTSTPTTTPMAPQASGGTEARPASETPDAASSASMDQSQSQGGFYTYQEGDQMLGSGLMGARVVGANDESIGEVDDLLLDGEGQVMAVVVGVGGFLGIGEKDVAIANDQLEFVLSQDAAAGAGSAQTGTAATSGMATTSPATGASNVAGANSATGAATTPSTTSPTGASGTMEPDNGAATGVMGEGWGWSGAGIDHIQVNFTREQLESAPAFETAE